MRFTEITEKEYEVFRKGYEKQNFWQSTEMCHLKKLRDSNWNYVYVGLKEEDTVVACTALVFIPIFMKYRAYMSLRGFMIDDQKIELVETFLKGLKEYLHKNNCLYFKVDPYIPYCSRNEDGEEIEGFKRDDLISLFENEGFKHQGFRRGHDHQYEPRWMSVLPIEGKDEATILKEMNIHTRQNIQVTKKTGIKIRELEENEFDILRNIIDETGERRHFPSPEVEYYKKFKQCFKEHMKALYAYLDVEDYIHRFDEERKKIEEELKKLEEEPVSKKHEHRKKEKEALLKAANSRYEEGMGLLKEYGKEIPLAAAMFVVSDYEVVYLFSGSDSRFKRYKAPYAIQWEMIMYCLKHHIHRYNFYGISGDFREEADDYGVFLFKKGFHAEVVELLGDFLYIDRKGIYNLYEMLRKVKHCIKK